MISIILPYYNDEKFLTEAISSILSQSYRNFELILINHGSSDSSRTLARNIVDRRIKHIDLKNNDGASGHRLLKIGISFSSGVLIKPFCADDIMSRMCIEKLQHAYITTKKDIIFSNMQEFVGGERKYFLHKWLSKYDIQNSEDVLRNYFIYGKGVLPFPTCLFSKELTFKAKCFNVGLIQMADMYLWASLLLAGKTIHILKDPLVLYRNHAEQMSSLANENLADRSFHEGFLFANLLRRSTDPQIIKSIWRNQGNKKDREMLDSAESKDDVEFISAYFMAKSHIPVFSYWGCFRLNEILCSSKYDPTKEKYNFSIKDYRELYTSQMNAHFKTSRSSKGIIKSLFKKCTFILGNAYDIPETG